MKRSYNDATALIGNFLTESQAAGGNQYRDILALTYRQAIAAHKLVADEAHYIPDAVFVAIRPMLATTGGTLDLLSTPRGNEGFFYDCFQSDDFHKIHIMSKDCPRITDEFLVQESKRMTKLEYCQEYEAEFLDSLQQFFSRELIEECFSEDRLSNARNFLGVDFAGAWWRP